MSSTNAGKTKLSLKLWFSILNTNFSSFNLDLWPIMFKHTEEPNLHIFKALPLITYLTLEYNQDPLWFYRRKFPLIFSLLPFPLFEPHPLSLLFPIHPVLLPSQLPYFQQGLKIIIYFIIKWYILAVYEVFHWLKVLTK